MPHSSDQAGCGDGERGACGLAWPLELHVHRSRRDERVCLGLRVRWAGRKRERQQRAGGGLGGIRGQVAVSERLEQGDDGLGGDGGGGDVSDKAKPRDGGYGQYDGEQVARRGVIERRESGGGVYLVA